MKATRLDELLDRYIDERLTPAEKSELEAALIASARARETFWTRMHFEGVLEEAVDSQRIAQWMAAADRPAHPAVAPHAGEVGGLGGLWLRWTRLMSDHPVLTALGAAAVAVFAFFATRETKPGPVVERTSNGVAVLASTWNVRWAAAQSPLAGGAVLSPGRIKIAAGVLSIEFYNGARMTLEGPADIELVRVDEVICHAGKLRVHVPHVARTFRVLTDRLDVLDLGTEFGLNASPDAPTEVHVFDGKVAWVERGRPAATATQEELVAGQAIRMNPAGPARMAAQPDGFVSGGVLERRLQEQRQERLRAWSEASRHIGEDARVVLHFDFVRDPALPRTLRNRAARTGPALDGVIVGSDWAEGRWPGKDALEFKQPGDRVRVIVPGEFDALTYVAWLRVQAVERMFTSIFLTDGFEPGEPHWQFFAGQIRLGIGDGAARERNRFLSPRVWVGPEGVDYTTENFRFDASLDRWIQLAVVMDTPRRDVSHYVDGRRVARDEMVLAQPLRIGDAELGNWGLPATIDPQPIRNFHGTMDEFTIYRTALSPDEIRTLFEEQRPFPAAPEVARAP